MIANDRRRPGPAIRAVLVGLVALATCSRARPGPFDEPPVVRKAQSHLADSKAIRERLGLSPAYDGMDGVELIRVAVLDYGFDGLGPGARDTLPDSAEIVEDYDPEFVRRFGLGDPEYRKPFEPAQSPRSRDGPDRLVGHRLASRAARSSTCSTPTGRPCSAGPIRYAIEKRVDVILFSGAFEGGGERRRQRADRPGRRRGGRPGDRLWINAAGNYGGQGLQRAGPRPARRLPPKLRNVSDVAALRFRNRADENTITVTLDLERLQGRGRRRLRQGPRPLRRRLDRPADRLEREGASFRRACRRASTRPATPESEWSWPTSPRTPTSRPTPTFATGFEFGLEARAVRRPAIASGSS